MRSTIFFILTAFSLLLAVMVMHLSEVNAKECTIYTIEQPSIDNYFNHNAAKAAKAKGYLVVRHKDIFDLENKVAQKLNDEKCTCLKELYIIGHANSKWISVGCGAWKVCDKKEYIAKDNKSTWEGTFNLILKSNFCKNPKIVFYGCAAGVCNNASEVLHTIAKGSGATVQAPIAITVKGSKIFDYLQSGEWQYGYPTDAKPQPCKNGKFITIPAKIKKASTEYYCPCNETSYSGIQDCTNGCSTSLSCFTNICDSYNSNNTWDNYSNNPVMTAGSAGSWDESGVSSPSVLRASPYAMWYTGWDSSNYESIGYATSPYGVNWTKHPNNPVLASGVAGSWDDYGVYNPHVIKDDGTYKMWYTGYSSTDTVFQIGYATSLDGITWTKDSNNPVLSAGASGTWDEDGVGAATVIKDGATYKMWYEGSDVGRWLRIGYATSPDGINWTRDTGNPVMSEGDWESYNEWGVAAPSVIKDDTTYHMVFIGIDGNNLYSIGYAYSPDGTNWTEAPDNPHFSRRYGGGWDSGDVGHPTLFKDGNEAAFKVFYRGQDESTWSIGYGVAAFLEGAASTSTTTAASPTTTTTTITTETTTTTIEDQPCPAEKIYGENAEQLAVLRYFRDNVFSQTPEGLELIDLYYQWAPLIVTTIEGNSMLKEEIKVLIDLFLLTNIREEYISF